MTEFVITEFDDFMEAYEAFQHDEFGYVMLSHNPVTRHYVVQALTRVPGVTITHAGRLPEVEDAYRELQDFFETNRTPVFEGFINFPTEAYRVQQ